MYLKFAWVLVFLVSAINALAVQDTTRIYWTSSAGIHRAKLNGQEFETLLSVTLSNPQSIAVDAVNRKVYWADRGTLKIQRSNLDGTDIEDLVSTSISSSLYGIAVDPIRGKIYWVDGGSPRRIQCSKLDGTNVEDVITDSDTELLRRPRGIAVDTDTGKIYWTETSTSEILRVNMDGTNAELVIADRDCIKPSGGLPIVVTGGKLYWISYEQYSELKPGLIKRANLDGTDIETVINLKNREAENEGRINTSCFAVDPVTRKIYWKETHSISETGSIMSANLDGTDIRQLIAISSSQVALDSMALNAAGDKIYWTDACKTDFGTTSMIRWANLDGTNIEDLISAEFRAPCGIAIDASESKIYWTDFGTNKIQRANLDCTHVEDIITTGLAAPTGLALDRLHGKIYWTNWKTGDIQRANIDGTDMENILTSVSARTIAVDAMAGRIYWTGCNKELGCFIQCANLDGANVKNFISGLIQPNGIFIDTDQGKIYWTDNGFCMTVSRANLDGTAREEVVTYPLDYANAAESLLRGITVDPDSGSIYWVDCSFGMSDPLGKICGSGIIGIIEPRFIALGTIPAVSVHITGKLATSWGRVRQEALLQNFPNPFNPDTWIPFVLCDSAEVEIRIYDVSGNLVRTLHLGQREPDEYRNKEQAAYWDGRNEAGEIVGSGIYFYQMRVGSNSFMRKAMMQR